MRSASVQFNWPTREEAERSVRNLEQNGDTYGDRLTYKRFLLPVTTPAELARVKRYQACTSFPCRSCGRHAFPKPDTTCFWCARARGE